MKRIVGASAALLLAAVAASSATAQEFYKGKSLKFVVSSAAGTSYDTFTRTTARHLEKHIPGNPRILVQNMPGAGGLVAANYLYNVAEKDGTTFAMLNRNSILQPIVGNEQAQYKSEGFHWLGTPATYRDDPYVFVVHTNTSYRKAEELRNNAEPISVGNSGSVMVRLLKEALGLNVRIVEGYDKSVLDLAFERGEVDGIGVGYTNLKARFPVPLQKGEIIPLVQFGSAERSPALPDVAAARELAVSDEARALLGFIEAPLSIAYPVALPPGVPEDRVRIMRKALEDTWSDPAYRKDIESQKLLYSPKYGDKVQAEVVALTKAPKAAIERFKEIAPGGGD